MSVEFKPVRAFLEASHATLLEKAQAFGRDVLDSRKAPENDEDGRGEARALLKLMGEAGLFEPIQARDYRGCCLVREALAFHSPLADAVFALQALGATPLLLSGTPLQMDHAHEAVSGKKMGAFAMTEPEAGSDAHGMTCLARREGDVYVLNGVKTLISNGGLADFYVVFAALESANPKSITAFLVDSQAAGFEFVRPLVMSAPHPLGEIAFRDCRVAESARIGKEGEGLKLALSTLDRLRATVGAAACGMAARALSEAIHHAQTRRQFGRPLADLQLIQEKIARMAIRLRASRLLVYEAAWEKDQGAERVTLESGMAKAFATESAQTVIDDAVQILGGRGVLKESMVDLLYRSVRALRIYEGTTEIQHLLVAAQLLKPVQGMKVVGVGAGPAALYLAILLKKKDASHSVTLFERHPPGESFGFGVVFSDATMDNLANADPQTIDRLKASFHHWDDIDVHYRGELLRSTGHGFSGVARSTLLKILRIEAQSLGVDIQNGVEIRSRAELPPADLVVAADGVASVLRTESVAKFGTRIDERKNRFVWLGTTRRFPAFTFYFKSSEHGLFRVHAYQYETHPNGENPCSTFIVEATDETFRRAGLSEADEAATVAYCEALFREELQGEKLIPNRSIWRRFPTIVNERWHDGSMVLIGDAAHTAHFSVGSGTKLAMEDSIALASALSESASIPDALSRYEKERRGPVESLQRAAQASLEWFEDTERYMDTPPIQFGFNLVTRSLRITHEDLRKRDPRYVAQIDAWYAVESEAQAGVIAPLLDLTERDAFGGTRRIAPPFLTPFKMRDLVLENRIVVSSMCQYSAEDGMPDDWHLVHLGSRALGGAGLVMAEMTDVTPDGRISLGCTGLYDDKQVKPWKKIVEFVHKNSTAKIGIQLGHAGRKGASTLEWEGDEALPPEKSWDLLAPSAMPWSKSKRVPREMTIEDMAEVKGHFAAAARRARKAGFDLLELHCAHGYLLASFLSPLTNHRTDLYGGTLENRLRYPLEVFDAVRAAWPPEKPLTVRISATDWVDGGVAAEEAVAIARAFKEHGCDLIDASAGQTVPEQRPRYGRLFQTPFADRIRHEAGIATMAVGAISSYADANTILAAGRADLVALARAHLYDPYWTRHAAQDFGVRLPWPDPYSSINRYTPRFR